MNKSIYVAGASSEIERAEAMMLKLRDAGWKVLSDWPEIIRAKHDGESNPMHISRRERRYIALRDLKQVEEASVLYLLLPEQPTIGAWWEASFALALMAGGQAKAMLCSGIERSIFTALITHYPTDEEAFQKLAQVASLTSPTEFAFALYELAMSGHLSLSCRMG